MKDGERLFTAHYDIEGVPEDCHDIVKRCFMKTRNSVCKLCSRRLKLVNFLWGNKSAWGPNGDDFDPDYIRLAKKIAGRAVERKTRDKFVRIYMGDDGDLHGTVAGFPGSKITLWLKEYKG